MNPPLNYFKAVISHCPESNRPVILKAMALQFSDIFQKFCADHRKNDTWHDFKNAIESIGKNHAQIKRSLDFISNTAYSIESELHDSAVPAMEALSLLEAALNPSHEVFLSAVETYFHVTGYFNIRLNENPETSDIDWIDLSTPTEHQIKHLIDPYIEYCTTHHDPEILFKKVTSISALGIYKEITARHSAL